MNDYWLCDALEAQLKSGEEECGRLEEKKLGNEKLPKCRTISRKRADSHQSGARYVSHRVPERDIFEALHFCHIYYYNTFKAFNDIAKNFCK